MYMYVCHVVHTYYITYIMLKCNLKIPVKLHVVDVRTHVHVVHILYHAHICIYIYIHACVCVHVYACMCTIYIFFK